MNGRCLLALTLALPLTACASDGESTAGPKTDTQYESEVTRGMHDSLLTDIESLHQASIAIGDAAPDHAWDADADADAIAAMTQA